MRLTQGAFSYLPDLTDDEIRAQIQYALDQGWACSVEFTDDPHPRNAYWEMWGPPMFDVADAAGVMVEVNACRQAKAGYYTKVNAFDSSFGFETTRLSFIVGRPAREPGFHLERDDGAGRQLRYSVRAYTTDRPPGERHG